MEGLNNQVVQGYYGLVRDIAIEFGANKAQIEDDIKNMLEFMKQLASITVPDEERKERFMRYHPMSINELQKTYPSIYWLELINNAISIPQYYLTETDIVSVASPKYISAIARVLQKSPKRAQANYAILQVVRSLELFLPKSIRNIEHNYKASGAARLPRWRECIEQLTSDFDILLAALYVRKYVSEETKRAATEMVVGIKDQMVNIVQRASWMDETTRKLALEKALGMKFFVGYPSELLDNKKLEQVYSNLSFSSDNFLLNYINESIFCKNYEVALFRSTFNNSDWRTRLPAIEINAIYLAHENSIQIPAITLKHTFFDKNRLNALNYGAIGYIIGHEVTHGFDDQGKQFNKDGNHEQWWAESTNEAFSKRAQCIIEQYSNYTVSEVSTNINGIRTQGENIADNGGVKEAYLAYTSWINRNGEELKLPGLKYTPKQLFWISVANTWCTLKRPEHLELQLSTDEHSPPEFRVIGPLSNSEYFATDFQCASNSKMNPKHKCQVW